MARVLVTGAASGIGAAVATHLTAGGWEVVKADLVAAGDVVAMDVGDAGAWQSVMAQHGPFDALVNSAGIRRRGRILDISREDWEQTINTNLNGTFYGTQAFAQSAVADGRPGAIVNIASINSVRPVKGQPHYCASKAGVAMVTQTAALELAEHGIRVNAVAPGSIDTPMQKARENEPGRREAQMAHIPLARLGVPADIAHGVAYLLSEQAAYVTGVLLPIDGGYLLA